MRFERKEKATVKRAITFTPRRQKEEYRRVVRGNVEGGKAGGGVWVTKKASGDVSEEALQGLLVQEQESVNERAIK